MKAFITVIGHDTVGVVAKVAGLCTELNINIEDVTQSILQGMFAMIMLVDLSNCNVDHDQLHKRTDALAAEMGFCLNTDFIKCHNFILLWRIFAAVLPRA